MANGFGSVEIGASALMAMTVSISLVERLLAKGVLLPGEADEVYEAALVSLERLPNLDTPEVRLARALVEHQAKLTAATWKPPQAPPRG